MTFIKMISTAVALFVASSANAATWTFSNVDFNDGTSVTGSFDYDGGVFSNISITTEINGWLGNVWDTEVTWASDTSIYFFSSEELQWEHALQLNFAQSLDSGLSAINVSGYEEWAETNGGYGFESRSIIGGQVVSAVPVPAAVWLFGSGLLGLMSVVRRNKAA